MAPLSSDHAAAFEALARAVRQMTPVGGGNTVPSKPVRYNLLARPHRNVCSTCKYPGHQASQSGLSTGSTQACREAIMSTIFFWEDVISHVSTLYSSHEPFHAAILSNDAAYEMRSDDYPPVGGSFEEIFVHRLTCNYLKFQAHFAGIRPKAMVILTKDDLQLYGAVSDRLNDFLLKGRTLTDLFESSIAKQE